MNISSLMRPLVIAGAFALPLGGLNAETTFGAVTDHQEMIPDTGIANRLAVGEVLRSLTQEIPAAACHLHNGVNVEDAADLLAAGVDQTTELLDALQYGDIFWGIAVAEERRKTIAELEQLRANWAPIQAAGRRLLADPANLQDATLISGAADALFDDTYALLTMLEAQYSHSAEILSRDVMYIHLSGRMTALNQAMALKACQLWMGEHDADLAAALRQSMQDYEGTLRALTDGLPQMGMLPPRTPGIADKLAEIGGIWQQNRPLLALVAVGEEISDQQRHDLYYQLVDERVVLLDLVYLYQDHAKVTY